MFEPGGQADNDPVVARLARQSLSAMAIVVHKMDAAEIAHSLVCMQTDPEFVISKGNETGHLSWDDFEAGGDLFPDFIEIRVAPGVAGVRDREALVRLLQRYAEAATTEVTQTKWPWLYWWRTADLPSCLVAVGPHPHAGRGLACVVHIGETRLSAAFAGGKPEVILENFTAHAARELEAWVRKNGSQALCDHPGFDIFIQKPVRGSPGLCVVRMPVLPFTPILPMETWGARYGINVFETIDELAELERFYQEPGAAFQSTPPFVRNRPPPSLRPSTLAGGIVDGRTMIVPLPWDDAGCAWCWTLPGKVLSAFPDLRNAAHRSRYLVQISRDVDAAKAQIAAVTRKRDIETVVVIQSTQHPRAQLPWLAPASGIKRHVVVGDVLDGRDIHALTMLARFRERPSVLVAAEDAADLRFALSGVTTSYDCAPTDVPEAMSGPGAPSIGLIVLDRDAASFACAALPAECGQPLAATVHCVILLRDDDGLRSLSQARSLAVKTGAMLLLVQFDKTKAGSATQAFNTELVSIQSEFGDRFAILELPPPPPFPLAALAAELFQPPPATS